MRQAVFIPMFAVLLTLVSVHSAVAAERTVVFQSDLAVPVIGTRSVGVLTVVYDDMSGEGSWNYDGTIDGQTASASGRGTFVVTTENVFELVMTTIESWNMPGLDPAVPRTATVRSNGPLAYVNYDGPVYSLLAVPVAIDPPLTLPVEGIYVLTNAGTGDDELNEIPSTGIGPGSGSLWDVTSVASVLMIVSLALLIVVISMVVAPGTVLARYVRFRNDDSVDVD